MAVLLMALLATAFSGCQTVGGRTITVKFRSSEGLRSGDAVYLAGVQVGECGAPAVAVGKSNVPVQLYRKHKDAVPAGTVFLLTADEKRSGQKCLIGYGADLANSGTAVAEVFLGATNWVELVTMVGAEKAKGLINRLAQ
jgi:hypothetical protein